MAGRCLPCKTRDITREAAVSDLAWKRTSLVAVPLRNLTDRAGPDNLDAAVYVEGGDGQTAMIAVQGPEHQLQNPWDLSKQIKVTGKGEFVFSQSGFAICNLASKLKRPEVRGMENKSWRG